MKPSTCNITLLRVLYAKPGVSYNLPSASTLKKIYKFIFSFPGIGPQPVAAASRVPKWRCVSDGSATVGTTRRQRARSTNSGGCNSYKYSLEKKKKTTEYVRNLAEGLAIAEVRYRTRMSSEPTGDCKFRFHAFSVCRQAKIDVA
jgi:hypothetical protein